MEIAIDFADPAHTDRVPRHGWAKNSQGLKILWLPILRLLKEAHERKARLSEPIPRGQSIEIEAFNQTLRHFVLTLRELAKCIRLASVPWYTHDENDEKIASYEARNLIPLHLDLVFVYARRIADHFARASRHVLFKKPEEAPREYKKLRPFIADEAKLRRLDPLCDINVLREAFERHSGWLDKLRDSVRADRVSPLKGIRDIMEHHPIWVTVRHSKVGEGPWELIADLGVPGASSEFRPDLIPVLKAIVSDMADLWTMVCASAALPPAEKLWVAPYGDALLTTGNADDAIAFWPES